jgi:hypothetical protein
MGVVTYPKKVGKTDVGRLRGVCVGGALEGSPHRQSRETPNCAWGADRAKSLHLPPQPLNPAAPLPCFQNLFSLVSSRDRASRARFAFHAPILGTKISLPASISAPDPQMTRKDESRLKEDMGSGALQVVNLLVGLVAPS